MRPDVGDFIGIPYEKMNCWELCVYFYHKVLGYELKHYYQGEVIGLEKVKKAHDLIYTNIGSFEKVEDPKFGDLMLLSVLGIESHIGIYIDNNVFLHTRKNTGSVLDRVSRWAHRLSGYYRVRDDG